MNFNEWRKRYDTLTFAEQQEYHNHLEALYPDQAHYDYNAAAHVFGLVNPKTVAEAGTWKANLAYQILGSNETITNWDAYELCPNAVLKTVCKDARLQYQTLTRFDWWNDVTIDADLFLATHFIEHLSWQHLQEMVAAVNSPNIYFEAPLTDIGEQWQDFHGTHKLTVGWDEITALMQSKGYTLVNINNHCKLYRK